MLTITRHQLCVLHECCHRRAAIGLATESKVTSFITHRHTHTAAASDSYGANGNNVKLLLEAPSGGEGRQNFALSSKASTIGGACGQEMAPHSYHHKFDRSTVLPVTTRQISDISQDGSSMRNLAVFRMRLLERKLESLLTQIFGQHTLFVSL